MGKSHLKKPIVQWPLVLKTRRVLRPFLASDYPAWVEAYRTRKPAKDEFDEGPRPMSKLTRAKFDWMKKRQRERARRDTGYVWGVFEKKTGTLLGAVDLYVFFRGDAQAANFGYFLHNQHRGKGFGREAARALALAAFRHLKLQRLEASVSPRNRASLRLIRSLGFRKECLRKNGDWCDGRWQDVLVFAATPDDFGLPMPAPQIQRRH